MKKKFLKPILYLLAVAITAVIGTSILSNPISVSAATKGESCTCVDGRSGTVVVDTAILSGCDCGGENGDSVIEILNLVVNIMSIGIGILGVIGITIVGIQYLTAGGSEEKTRKAKRRMFEIVLGLVAYVVIYALLKWLLPEFGGQS